MTPSLNTSECSGLLEWRQVFIKTLTVVFLCDRNIDLTETKLNKLINMYPLRVTLNCSLIV